MKTPITTVRSKGFTLFEVLIALVVLSVGLLGLASLETNTLKFNQGAYLRTQATNLAYDMADRMRANRAAAIANAYDDVAFADPLPDCDPTDVAGADVAERDISAWRIALICALPLGNGSIDTDGRTVTINVQWDETRGSGALEQFQMVTSL
ncbi:MAG TPA: type IV pilus modification protein PilV [Gammaproteobacteria bacterium]|jgi:type IV pilus assembly protein PilV|nr:type IV pilus modification protein PilV [Gammaproteobacteria bacterium]